MLHRRTSRLRSTSPWLCIQTRVSVMASLESALESGEWGYADGRRGAVGNRSARWAEGALLKKKNVEKWQTGGVRDKVVLWEK